MTEAKFSVKLTVKEYSTLIAGSKGLNWAIQISPLVELYLESKMNDKLFGFAVRKDLSDGYIYSNDNELIQKANFIVQNLVTDFEVVDRHEFDDIFTNKVEFGGVFNSIYHQF